MKIYTKKGDDGTTALFGGRRLNKNHKRIEAYGTVDELNAYLGHAVLVIGFDEAAAYINRIQNELFILGSDLATPLDTPNATILRIDESHVDWMESAIDAMESELEPLRSFILPGGAEESARIHLCRAVCRRAERACVSLTEGEAINPWNVKYLNRLSDFLFVLARWLNHKLGIHDVRWVRP